MIAQRFFSRPTSVWLTLAALAIGSASANAQATKTAPTTKLQEKAKAKKAEEKAAALVDVNSASAAEMEEKLPGVGPALAKAIVDGRPYKNLAALGKVKGIGEAKLADLKGLVSFEKPAAATPKTAAAKVGTAKEKMEKAEPKTKVAAEKADGPVDVNTASAAEMEEKLPGVGPALAKAIVDGRPYKNLAALGKVKGIGEAKLADLKGLVSFEKPAAATPKATAAKADTPKEKMEKAEAKTKVAAKEKEEEPPTTKPKVVLADGKKVNINKATAEDLDSLFGIGEVRAKAIIAGRPYEKIEDIMKVKGIKEGTFEKIKDAITVK